MLTQGAPGVLDVPGDGSIIVTIEEGAALNNGDSFAVTYRSNTAPTTGGDYEFVVPSKSTAGGDLTALTASPITINVEVTAAGTAVLTDSAGMFADTPPGVDLGNLRFNLYGWRTGWKGRHKYV